MKKFIAIALTTTALMNPLFASDSQEASAAPAQALKHDLDDAEIAALLKDLPKNNTFDVLTEDELENLPVNSLDLNNYEFPPEEWAGLAFKLSQSSSLSAKEISLLGSGSAAAQAPFSSNTQSIGLLGNLKPSSATQ